MRITIHQVAERAGVSLATVSHVFNNPDRVGKLTREKVLEAAYHVGYLHRKKRKRRLGAVGIVADNFANITVGEFYNMVAWGIFEEIKNMQLNIMLEAVSAEEGHIPQFVVQNLVDGVLFFGKVSRDVVLMTKNKNIPLVLVGHPIPDLELHTVLPDNRAGATMAAEHLIGKGHKKFAVIIGEPLYDPITADRLEGFRFGLTKVGIQLNHKYIVQADFGLPDSAIKATEKLLKLADPPTAIFCFNDSFAFRCIQTIEEHGLKVPGDVAVMGFDLIHVQAFAKKKLPTLTTIDVNQRQLGRAAVKTLIEVIANPEKIAMRYTLPVSLIKGATT